MRSGFERDVSKLLKKHKIAFKYEPFDLEFSVVHKYKPDFVSVINGHAIVIETKGRFTGADRNKLKRVKAAHPNMDIRLWFMQDQWTTKRKTQKNSDWARKHGFPCHVGLKFPTKWFK